MDQAQWQEMCGRMGAIWPGKKMPQGTVDEWFRQFGSWADYESVGLVIATLGATSKRMPALSDLRDAYSQRGGAPKAPRPDVVAETPEERERWNAIAQPWLRINRCRHDPRIAQLIRGLREVECDPLDMRDAVLAEIEHLGVQEEDPKPMSTVEGWTLIGDALPGVLPS